MAPKLLKNTNYAIIPNGVDLKLFMPLDKKDCRVRLGLSLDKKYILFPADPDRKEKNFSLARNAFEITKRKTFDELALLVVHKLSYEELLHYYNAVDVCILTSYSEGSPNVIKECMACNVPIVSTEVGDVKEIFNGIEGCFLSSQDPEDFSCKLFRALAYNRRTQGRDKISHIEINLIARRIIDIYKSI